MTDTTPNQTGYAIHENSDGTAVVTHNGRPVFRIVADSPSPRRVDTYQGFTIEGLSAIKEDGTVGGGDD